MAKKLLHYYGNKFELAPNQDNAGTQLDDEGIKFDLADGKFVVLYGDPNYAIEVETVEYNMIPQRIR